MYGSGGSIPIFQKYYVVGASCSLDIKRGQDARTTIFNIWDAPLLPLDTKRARCPHYKFKYLGCSREY